MQIRTRAAVAMFVVIGSLWSGALGSVADAKPKKPKKPKQPVVAAGVACANEFALGEVAAGRLVCMMDAKGKLLWHHSHIPYADAATNAAARSALPATTDTLRTEPLAVADEAPYWAYLSSAIGYYLPGEISGYSIGNIVDVSAAPGTAPLATVSVLELVRPANGPALIALLAGINDAQVMSYGANAGFVIPFDGVDIIYVAFGSHLTRTVVNAGRGNEIINAMYTAAGIEPLP
jgi:hypothetical protein